VRHRPARRHLDRAAQQRRPLLDVPLEDERAAKVGEGPGVVGHERQRPAVRGDGAVELALLAEERAEEVVRVGVPGGELRRQAVAGERRVGVAEVAPGGAEVEQRRHVPGIEAQGVLEGRRGLEDVPALGVRHAQADVGADEVAVGRRRRRRDGLGRGHGRGPRLESWTSR
jgi:hypothetical protein